METALQNTSAVNFPLVPRACCLFSQSQESVQAHNQKQESVPSCVPMTVTVRTMRNAAAMDVNVSVWIHIQ
ncbi:hypothetical protein R3I93_004391 [Phoxinus phoxinus]|uniref:Uncharacterized protein n=1 Tax=Phoxinus phoxinus TaxID=58324 RepID=A0AAN9DK77_9TELE